MTREVKLGLMGEAPFNEPITNLKAIGYMYNWAPMHFSFGSRWLEKYGIDSLDDLATSGAKLKIGINRAGNITVMLPCSCSKQQA